MNLLNVILSGIVSAISVIVVISSLIKNRFSLKDILKFIIIFMPFSIMICLCSEGVKRISSIIFITTISLYFSIFNKDMAKSIYYSLAYELLAFIVELAICIVEICVFKFDQSSYESIKFAMLLTSIVNVILIYIIVKIPFISKQINEFFKFLSNRIKDWIHVLLVIVLLIFLMAFNGYNLKDSLSFYINVGMVIFTIIMLIYFVYNSYQKNSLENKYNEMMEYVSKYEKIINEQGKKNHEYNNQLMVLKGYLNKPDKLKEYLNLIIDDHKCGQNYTIKQLGYFPDGGIKGLIYHKLSRMEEFNIKPYLYIDSSIKNIFEEKFDSNTYKDITKLLGVFLDNSIEAAKDADPKEIEFEIKKDDNCLIISISNTYDNKCDVSQIGKKGYSTKGAGHGFGLSIVKDISKNNKNIETFSEKDNGKFKQTAIIYYK